MEVGVQRLVRDDSNLVLLPKQLWCSLRERENGETCSEAGWLFDNGHAITSRCILSRDAEAKVSAFSVRACVHLMDAQRERERFFL